MMKFIKVKTGWSFFGKIHWLRQKWHFQIKKNGRVIASSEQYFNEADVDNAIKIIQNESAYAEIQSIENVKLRKGI